MLNRRAVSEVVGALLMIALAVTAGVVVYVYSSGLIGGLQGAKVNPPYMEKIALDYYRWILGSSSNGTLTLILRNTGSSQVTLADFFIEGNPMASNATTFGSGCLTAPQNPQTLNVNGAGCQVQIFYSSLSFTSGVAYNVRVVTSDGAIFNYSCIAGTTG